MRFMCTVLKSYMTRQCMPCAFAAHSFINLHLTLNLLVHYDRDFARCELNIAKCCVESLWETWLNKLKFTTSAWTTASIDQLAFMYDLERHKNLNQSGKHPKSKVGGNKRRSRGNISHKGCSKSWVKSHRLRFFSQTTSLLTKRHARF